MAYCGPSGNGIGPSFPYMGNHHTEMLDLQRHGVGAIIVPQFFSSGWWGMHPPIPMDPPLSRPTIYITCSTFVF